MKFKEDFLTEIESVSQSTNISASTSEVIKTPVSLNFSKPLQIQEIVFSEAFADSTDDFFREVGNDNIFMKDIEKVSDKALEVTIDYIISRLYETRSEIG